MDLDQPSSSNKQTLDNKHCILCFKLLGKNENNITRNPTTQGLTSILQTAKLKNDDVFHRLSFIEDDILNLKVKVAYHRSCRASYTSKSNLKTKQIVTEPINAPSEPKRLKRDLSQHFNIRTDCFICGRSQGAI